MQLYRVVSSNQGGLFANLIPPCYLLRSQRFPVSTISDSVPFSVSSGGVLGMQGWESSVFLF